MEIRQLFVQFVILVPVLAGLSEKEVQCLHNVDTFAGFVQKLDDLPKNPNIAFYLYTSSEEEPVLLDENSMKLLDFYKPIKIIVHGWMGDYQVDWVQRLKDVYLQKCATYQIILVDYGNYSKKSYTHVAAKVRQIATKLAEFLSKAHTKHYLDVNLVHLIGHSFGAHICGLAARYLKNYSGKDVMIGRVTGLDPAGPLFERTKSYNDSAKFVDIYHTCPFFFGIRKAMGTVDFYIEAGNDCLDEKLAEENLTNGLRFVKSIVGYINMRCGKIIRRFACYHAISTGYYIQKILFPSDVYSDRGWVTIGECAKPHVTGIVNVILNYKNGEVPKPLLRGVH